MAHQGPRPFMSKLWQMARWRTRPNTDQKPPHRLPATTASKPAHALAALAGTVPRANPFWRTSGHRWPFWQNALQPQAEHRYNDPNLTPLAFLQAVFNDSSVPMHLRMLAAERAAPYDHQPMFIERELWPGEHRITIVIQGLGIEARESKDHEPEVKVH